MLEVRSLDLIIYFGLISYRCQCVGHIQAKGSVNGTCTCLSCHYQDSRCVYCPIDGCIECGQKYDLIQTDMGFRFSCENRCEHNKASPLFERFKRMNDKMLNTPTPPTHKTLLHSSVLACDAELTWCLLNKGANPFIRDDLGVTPIDLARLLFTSKATPTRDETLIYNMLPKKSYPDIDADYSLDFKKMRTRSDLGVLKSPGRGIGSPPKVKDRKHSTPFSPPKQHLVPGDSPGRHGHGQGKGLQGSEGHYYDQLSPNRPSTSPRNRQRSVTISEHMSGQSLLSTVAETSEGLSVLSLLPPPLPPVVHDHSFVQRSQSSSPRYERSLMKRSSTLTHTELESEFEHTFTHLRERAMSEAAATLSHHKAREPLLRGFVSAGRRHANANAPALRKGTQIFTEITLLKLTSGSDCAIMDPGEESHVNRVTHGEFGITSPSRTRSRTLSGMGAIAEGGDEMAEGLEWELSQLKDVLVAELEIDNVSAADYSESESDSDSDSDCSDEDDSDGEGSDEDDASGGNNGSSKDGDNKGDDSDADDSEEAKGEEEGEGTWRVREHEGSPSPPPVAGVTTNSSLSNSPSAALIRKMAQAAAQSFQSGRLSESSDLDNYKGRSPIQLDTSAGGDDNSLVSCTACMDTLKGDHMAYACHRPSCLSYLCKDCMFRSTFVCITSALYAVPSMRCPGRCMGRIPTRTWRGALKGVAVTDDDRKSMNLKDKVKKYPLLKRLDYLFESFEVFCEGYEQGMVEPAKRVKHVCNLLHRVELVVQYDDFTIQNVYNYAEESGLVLPGSDLRVIDTFEAFSKVILPEKSVSDDEISDSFLMMEDMLNDDNIESSTQKSRNARLERMCTFLAEIAVIVRTRLDVSLLHPISPDKVPSSDAEGLLMRAYCSNALALLTMRCGQCEETNSLFYCRENDCNIVTLPEMRQKVLASLLDPLSNATAVGLMRIWSTFDQGRSPAGTFVSSLLSAYIETIKRSEEEDKEEQIKKVLDSVKLGILRKGAVIYFYKALSLILDMERRFAVQLEMLRRYPKIRVPCCNSKHCFLCKVEGFHDDKTCAEVQQAAIGKECQYCPGCGVATLRTEGCPEIFCVCGTTWTWEGDEEENSDFEEDGMDKVDKADGDAGEPEERGGRMTSEEHQVALEDSYIE